ncbi:MAG TPA: helix-turn-helix transcriptional regulator, partial [Dehalococcoidia bacterium]|nr:helix-turn-helix transcriptional regulator [Dehalococcoidia bacterium]
RYHRRAGEAIEAISAGRPEPHLEELARHFGLGNVPDKAAVYAYQAAEENARLHNWARAGPLYGQAAAALTHLPDSPAVRRQRIEACLKQVTYSFVTEKPERNLDILTEARRLAGSLVKDATPTGPELRSEDEGADDRLLMAHLDYWIGRVLVYQLDYPAALEYLGRAQAAAEAAGQTDLRALAVSTLGRTMVEMGRFDTAAPLLAEAADVLAQQGKWSEWIWNNVALALSLAARGHFQAGVVEAQRSLARAHETQNASLEGPAQLFFGLVHLMGGDLGAAAEAGRAAVAAGETSGIRFAAHLGSGLVAWSESRRGNYHSAADWFDRHRTSGGSLGARLVFTDWFTAADAEFKLLAGDPAAALAAAQAAVGLGQLAGGVFAEGLAHRVWGLALATLQNAASDTRRSSPTRPQPEAATSIHSDDTPEAHFALSIRLLESGAAVLEAARTHVAWGLLARDRGDTAAAADHLDQAAITFEAAGLTAELATVRTALANLAPAARRSSGPPGGPHPAGLSDREVQVIQLIAAGRTTKEIAAQLFVSVATVERHITHLYTKIGARSRVDATAFALAHGLTRPERDG